MCILLLRPFFSVEKFYFPRYIDEPLGLEYLAAYLKKHTHHDVHILDAVAEGWNRYLPSNENPDMIYQGISLEKIIKKIKKINPDIIGITWLFSTQNNPVNTTAAAIKKALPHLPVVVGGPHPSADPREVLKNNPAIDIVVFGEGEITLKELLDYLERGEKNLTKILGIAYQQNSEIKVNGMRPLIHNLDELPLPERELVPYQNYAKQNVYEFIFRRLKHLGLGEKKNKNITRSLSNIHGLNKIYFALHNQKRPYDLVPKADIITSRGCPNHCTFCAIHNLWGHRWRARSAKNVLAEIDKLVRQFGIRHINFQDDNFNVSKQRTIEICQGLIERKYGITIIAHSGAFVPTLDEEILTWLKKAGMSYLRMSIESGNQRILDEIIQKKIDLSKVKGIVDICKKLGIKTEGAFIFGVPGETIETMQDSLKFANYVGFDRVIRFIYQPFPNTKLYQICEEKGYLTANYDPRRVYITGKKSYVKTDKFTPEDVMRIARQ